MSACAKMKSFFSGDRRTATVAKNAFFSILLKGVSIIVSFMLVPLTIGYVSAELYGVWLTLSSIVTWLGFLDIGFCQGLKNKLTEALAKNDTQRGKKLVSTTYFLMIIIFVPVGVIAQFVIPFVDWCRILNVSSVYQEEIVQTMHVLVAFCCLQQIANVLVSVIAAFQKVALSNSFSVIGNVISLCVICFLIKLIPSSLVMLCFALTAMPIVVCIVASIILYFSKFALIRPSLVCVDLKLTKDLFNLGYKFFIINLQVIILFQSTNILIANVSSSMWVTSYNIAYKLLGVAMMIYNIIVAPLWPAYTDAFVREDYDWMKKMRKKMEKILLLSIFGCVLITLSSPLIYDLWIGNKAEIPFMMTILVALYVIVCCWRSLNGTLVVGMGKMHVQTINVTIGMILHIPLSLLLSRYIGVYGILVSLIAINAFYAIMMQVQVTKLLNKTATGIWSK